jgi:hypothetical protein
LTEWLAKTVLRLALEFRHRGPLSVVVKVVINRFHAALPLRQVAGSRDSASF